MIVGRTRNDIDIKRATWCNQNMEIICHGSKDLVCVRVVVHVKYITVQMLMSIGKLQKKNDCAFVALVTIIKAKIVKGPRNVGLMGSTLVVIACCTILNERKTCRSMGNKGTTKPPEMLQEGAADGNLNITMTTCSDELSEDHSLQTVPAWAKANRKKIKINAILDDASNETFLNEDVAGALGIQEPYEKVKVHVQNEWLKMKS